MQELTIKVKKLHKDAIVPYKKNKGDAGWDLYAIEDVVINPGDIIAIRTGIALGIPKGYRIAIRDRSGMAIQGLTVTGGVVDQIYVGEIKVCLANIQTRYMMHLIFDLLKNMMTYTIKIVMSEIRKNTDFEFEEYKDDNLDAASYYIQKGDRIAQFVLEEDPQFVTLLEVDELEKTVRGSKNFGSSGK